LKIEGTRRLKMKLKSKSNAKNKITAISRLASPVFRYTLVQLLRGGKKKKKARELLTAYKIHHPNGDIDRLYGNKERRNKRLVTHLCDKANTTNKYMNTIIKLTSL
jgi:hypothetical protein